MGPHPRIEFHATVQPDTVITKTMLGYLRSTVDPKIFDGKGPRIARLLESNTTYGVGMNSRPEDTYEPEYIDLHFPLHISRLRSDARGAGASVPTIGLVSRFRPLALGDESRPTDQLPIFTPQTTTAYVELVLSRILDTIRREQIHIIGIMATDARDKLFLARQISMYVPNAILYTTESDMLYVHPDYLQATAGMLIASPYPLYRRNQTATHDTRHDRRQFATSSIEGVYNATLALMKYRRGRSSWTRSIHRWWTTVRSAMCVTRAGRWCGSALSDAVPRGRSAPPARRSGAGRRAICSRIHRRLAEFIKRRTRAVSSAPGIPAMAQLPCSLE